MDSRSASLCADALKRAGSPQAPATHQRAVDYANALMRTIRDPRLRKLFPNRPINAALFETTPAPFVPLTAWATDERHSSASPRAATRGGPESA